MNMINSFIKTVLTISYRLIAVSLLAMVPFFAHSHGPGMDGGGGVSVVDPSNGIRFWDIAKSENIKPLEFSAKHYNDIMLRSHRFVKKTAHTIEPKLFFQCAIDKFKQNENIYLKIMANLTLNLQIALTQVPFPTESNDDWKINIKSTTGWTYSLKMSAPDKLKSNNLEKHNQRPIAAYVVQSIDGLDKTMKVPTLIVQSQLYESLSNQDQCAMQVHELLRWMAHDNPYESTWLLTRDWTHREIEDLTAKIIHGHEVKNEDIPASPVLKLMSKQMRHGKNYDDSDNSSEFYTSSEEIHTNDNRPNGATALILRRMIDNANESIFLAEIGIADISKLDSTRLARAFINKNKAENSDTKWIDLCEALPEAKETTTKCWNYEY